MATTVSSSRASNYRRLAGYISTICFGLSFALLVTLILPSPIWWLGAVAVLSLVFILITTFNAPEVVFVLFIFAGQFKETPIFARISGFFDITVLMAIMTIVGLSHRFLGNNHKYVLKGKFLTMWFLFCIFMTSSLLWTLSDGYGLYKVGTFITLSSLSMITPLLIFDSRIQVRRLFFTISSFCTVLSFFAVRIGLEAVSRFQFVNVPGSNYLGLGYTAGIGFVVSLLYFVPRGGWSTIFGTIAVVLSGLALLLSGGRGPLISLAFTLLVVALVSLKAPGRFERTTVLLSLLLALLFLGLIQFKLLPFTISYRLSLLLPFESQHRFLVDENATTGRPERWQAAWEAMASHPILGLGIGGFANWFTGQNIREYPHNIFFEAGAELGFPGLILMISLFWIPLKTLLRSSNIHVDREIKMLRTTALGIMIFSWMGAMFSGDFNDHRLVWMSAGLLAASYKWQAN